MANSIWKKRITVRIIIKKPEYNNGFYHDNEYSAGQSEDTGSCESNDGNEHMSYKGVNPREQYMSSYLPKYLKMRYKKLLL